MLAYVWLNIKVWLQIQFSVTFKRHMKTNNDTLSPTSSVVQTLHLRIEIQIFSLHWMMQNIRLFNVCEARRASRRH